MAGSILVAVRAALISQLDELGPLAKVECGYAWKKGSKRRERIFTRRGHFNQVSASLKAGRNFRNETGQFELVILVEGVGRDAEWTSGRAMDLGLACEEFIADHKNDELGVEHLRTLYVDGAGEINELYNDRGCLAEISYPIEYTARLT